MTRLEKCKLAIAKGCKYNPKTGVITGVLDKEVKSLGNQGYINMVLCANSKRYNLRANHFAYFCVYNECDGEIDHKNGIKHDNRICNLRKVTTQENAFNRLKAKGYSWNKAMNKWVSHIKIDGTSIHIGYFDNEQDAHDAYLLAKQKHHIILDNEKITNNTDNTN